MLCLCLRFASLFFFLFLFFFFHAFPAFREKNYCSRTVAALFMGPTTTLFRKNILKMGPTVLFTHLKIILLQCFQFLIFSFSKNKLYSNGPYVLENPHRVLSLWFQKNLMWTHLKQMIVDFFFFPFSQRLHP